MQSKIDSAVEQTLNLASGFVIALLLMQFVIGPLYGLEVTVGDNIGITVIFTVVSFVRGYVWRRLFNNKVKRRQRCN